MSRVLVLCASLLFVFGFAFLTISAAISRGFSLGILISVLILVLVAVGLLGALLHPPRR